MIRFISAIYLLGALAINLLFQSDVSLTMDVAPQINAGSELLVQVSLKKKDLSGFCRFQQELPAGFTATSISTSNADFTFKDQKVRFIWLKLPDEENITISYKISCDERLKGSFNLTGKFSYIEDNERKSVDVAPKQLVIVPSPNINPAMLVDVNDFGKTMTPGVAETDFGRIACVRQKPVWSSEQNEYVVNLLVNKDKLEKFAKIEELVPKGFTALNINSRNGIFTFKDGKAKFLWMSLPVDPYFVVSYKLVPTNGITSEALAINGAFSYIVDDKTQSIAVFERETNLLTIKPEEIAQLLRPEVIPPVVVAAATKPTTSPTAPQTLNVPENKNQGTNVAANNTAKAPVNVITQAKPIEPKTEIKQPIQTQAQVPIKEVAKQPDTPSFVTKPRETEIAVVDNENLKPGSSGVYFRIQIAAGHKPVNIKSYFRKFKLEKSVTKEDHEGWIKYSVGSFDAYRDARDYRVHLWNTTPITDAFVSAYNEGSRITVQEALMISEQKWTK